MAHLVYNWTNYGEYKISVKAYDSETESAKYEHTIFIDVYPIEDEIVGYLIDDDSDDLYNSFDDSDTNYKSDVKKDNDTYLIDTDLDGKWDYAYDFDIGLSTYYEFLYNKYMKIYLETPGFELLSLLTMIGLLIIIYKRRK
jgi:tetrahydromethanopterin S-methyltransferase subunit B